MSEEIRARSWTRREYHRLAEVGVLRDDEPVELLGGRLIVAEPKGTGHSVAVHLAAQALARAFGAGWTVRVQDAIALDDESEPEPDVAVALGATRDYLAEHPVRPALVVEVAETSLAFDRAHKGSLYARAGLPDYWIVNLVERVVEVHRTPAPAATAPFGWAYREIERVEAGATIVPLALPGARVRVDDLLP